MKKLIIVAFILVFILAGSSIRGQTLKSGEAVIFLNNGDRVIGEIEDISSRRLVLELKDGTEIKLSDIWMINFINQQWHFPQEIASVKTPHHYLFLRDGNMTFGKIVDFSTNRRVFELDTGEEVKFGAITRIYFTNRVPPNFKIAVPPKKVKIRKR
jgi:hypothetical protein